MLLLIKLTIPRRISLEVTNNIKEEDINATIKMMKKQKTCNFLGGAKSFKLQKKLLNL